MSKRKFVGVMVVALAVVVMAGGLLASNMGFKLNYQLAKSPGGVIQGLNTLALPDNRQTGLNTAKNLMDDVGFANVLNVQKFLKLTDSYSIYTGRAPNLPSGDFSLTQGEGVFVRMRTTVNYIVVGSDDPTLAYSLTQAGAGVSNTGLNLYAYNYHQTAATAKALMDDITFARVLNVQRFLKATDSYSIYTGRAPNVPAGDFSLTPGEAYFVRMRTTVSYTPSHY